MPVLSQKGRGTRKKEKNSGATDKVSLSPLAFEDAVRAALATGKAPPAPKRKPKGKK